MDLLRGDQVPGYRMLELSDLDALRKRVDNKRGAGDEARVHSCLP